MLTVDEKLQKMIDLSGQIMRLGRNSLLVNLRFMDAALSRLTPVAVYQGMVLDTEDAQVGVLISGSTLATDGQFLAYSPVFVLNAYREEQTRPARDTLHAIMHCVFRHMYMHSLLERRCWDLACDIAVENAITELGIPAVRCERQDRQRFVINGIQNDIGLITAEKLYRYYMDKKLPEKEMSKLEKLFRADEHDLWYLPSDVSVSVSVTLRRNASEQQKQRAQPPEDTQERQDPQDQQDRQDPQEQQPPQSAQGQQPPQAPQSRPDGASGDIGTGADMTRQEAEKDWQDVSERMQTDMETFSKSRGDMAGGLMQNLREVNREKYDYTEFLKKFAVMGEVMKINDDEFDYIYYTYGLKLYKKVPLIEPLEYKETKRIREFVIAIDTSGSVQGDLVQTFLNKTYNIMMSTESFFSKVNVHIIQCDAAVQEHVKITSREEFEEYLKKMKLHGFGGTDFRPVFSLVGELMKQKEFTNLKGLIYFTDGYGVFPDKKPPYETAFVFINDRYGLPEVPPWAIRLVLQKEDI